MKRIITGKVVSDKMDKTVVVAVGTLKKHPIYKKNYKQTNTFKAHDENNKCKKGDVVEITETRPISKDKHFSVSKIVSTNEVKK